jgi:hypothetical protein
LGLFGDVRDATDVCFAFGVDTTAEGILKAPNVCAVGEILPAKVCVAIVADRTLAATEVGAAGEIAAAKVCVAIVADRTLAATEVGAAGEILAAKVCVAAAGEIAAAKVAAGVAAAADEIPGLAEVCVADAAGPFDSNCGALGELVGS